MATPMALFVILILLGLILVYLAYRSALNDTRRGALNDALRPSVLPSSQRKIYTLKAPPPAQMTDISERDFSYEDEYRAAAARQRVWIQYEDRSGNITE